MNFLRSKNDIGIFNAKLNSNEANTNDLSSRVVDLEDEKNKLLYENSELKERVIDVQARSMRENLIFSGIDEAPDEQVKGAKNSHTENQLKLFIKEVTKIEDEMQFHVVHRLRPRDDGKPRSIIARFERRKDRDLVLQRAPATLKDTSYRVNEQLPMEIIERRNELWPIYKRGKRLGNECKFKGDVLYVNNVAVYPSSKRPVNRRQMRTQNSAPHIVNQPMIPIPTHTQQQIERNQAVQVASEMNLTQNPSGH
ncbi:unnamed protein product [Mytilus coruscus]|uniref:Uncharacterized protein n=1 Tax=Mytilus coruscus TaxID=42192 RepID=A0A6J8A804_MYTCO|nr:unnamed protein product [Mytilus coruscus]